MSGKFCWNCDNEADWIEPDGQHPMCETCADTFRLGQTLPEAGLITIKTWEEKNHVQQIEFILKDAQEEISQITGADTDLELENDTQYIHLRGWVDADQLIKAGEVWQKAQERIKALKGG